MLGPYLRSVLPPPLPGRLNLLCVLDWGLGHAARSLALAEHLLLAGERVIFAASGPAAAFLCRESPGTPVHDLPAYRVTYPSRSMPLNVARQLPHWLGVIVREHRRVRTLVEELGVDRIVSDNRFGCYAPDVDSIFLTHQLHPITRNRPVSAVYRRYLQRFDAYWVPDHPAADRRISGQLSDPAGYANVRYVGPLSRLRPVSVASAPESVDVLALLSGPEPMRTQLENILLPQLADRPGRHVLVRGLPAATTAPAVPGNVTVHNFADARLLARLLTAAGTIVCRSGYSTLMDVYAVTDPKKLLLVPTPGQTEQEYLAAREATRTGCRFVRDQRDLRL